MGMDCAEDKILIFLQAHARILGIGIGGIERGHPFERALGTAPHLGFGDRAERLAAPLGLQGIDVRRAARVGRRVNADAALELVVGDLIKRGDEIELGILGVGQIHLVLAERHHARQGDHGVGDAAFFQDLDVQLTDQRLGGGGRFDQDAVAGDDAGGMLHQDFCKICYTGIGHGIPPLKKYLQQRL